ncbi:MAG TPA: D-alanyl-D-alanine carboxypeptidase, partial [Acidimicrobiales bacterium]|nr:D-alanyl-D-alanine carboxypeptidase [Acidimicrobiales bacterium]
AAPTEPAAAGPIEDYRARVLAALGGSTADAAVVVSVEGVGRVVDLSGAVGLPPASTQKLYTVGAALARLGPDARLRTEVRRVGALHPDGTLAGDLVVVGGGDPTLDRKALFALGHAVARAGVRRVTGALYIDDTRHDRARSGPGWRPDWVPSESGPLSSFAVDRNGWRRDAAFLAEPAGPNGERARIGLGWGGVAFGGPTRLGAHPHGPGELVTVRESPTLAELARGILKGSDNFASELLLKELGARVLGQGSTGGGIEAVNRLADELGVPRGFGADGSGLSPISRHTAAGEVAWLEAMDRLPSHVALRGALAVACGDGTLRTRLCGTAAAGRMAAKTGTLPGVVTLAGYTTTTGAGRRVTFAVMLANARNPGAARAAMDRAAAAIATFPG